MSSHDKKNIKVLLSKKYTFKEISKHNKSTDCWIILANRVYDITNFLENHPGGSEILLEFAGKNATDGFIEAGHVSNFSIIKTMSDFIIGCVDDGKLPKF